MCVCVCVCVILFYRRNKKKQDSYGNQKNVIQGQRPDIDKCHQGNQDSNGNKNTIIHGQRPERKTDTHNKEHKITKNNTHKATQVNKQHGLHYKLGAWIWCTNRVSSAFLETPAELLIKSPG